MGLNNLRAKSCAQRIYALYTLTGTYRLRLDHDGLNARGAQGQMSQRVCGFRGHIFLLSLILTLIR